MLSGKNTNLFGIDISSTSVKVLQLSKQGTNYKVENFAIAQIDGSLNNPEDPNAGTVAALKKAIKESGIKSKDAVIVLNTDDVYIKTLGLQAGLNEFDLEDQVKVELQRDGLPINIDEAAIDFQRIGPVQGSPELDEILLTATRQELIDNNSSILEASGLKLKCVDVSQLAISNLLEKIVYPQEQIDPKDIVALIDIGDSKTTLLVFKEGKIIFSREQNFGGRELINNTINMYSGYKTAQDVAIARIRNELPADYEASVLEPFKASVANQINRLIQLYSASSGSNFPKVTFLTGGVAAIPELADYVGTMTGLDCRVANPFIKMPLSSKVDVKVFQRAYSALFLSCAIALRAFDDNKNQVNLLPWREERRKKTQKEFGIMVGVSALFGAALAFGLHTYNTGIIKNQEKRNDTLEKGILRLDEKIKEVTTLEDEKAKLLARKEVIETLQGNRYQMVKLFDVLSKNTPNGIRLTEVKQANGMIEITGRSESNTAVSQLMLNLEQSGFLFNPEVVVIELSPFTGSAKEDEFEKQRLVEALGRFPYIFSLKVSTEEPKSEDEEESEVNETEKNKELVDEQAKSDELMEAVNMEESTSQALKDGVSEAREKADLLVPNPEKEEVKPVDVEEKNLPTETKIEGEKQ